MKMQSEQSQLQKQYPRRINELGHFKEIRVGAGVNLLGANSEGFWIGSDHYSNAPFRVSYDGVLYASGAIISGATISGSTVDLADTGVTAGEYGDSGNIPTFTVGADGRISSASETAIVLPNSGVTAATYGNGKKRIQVTVNSKGIVTSVAEHTNDMEIGDANAYYMGDSATDGSWRIVRSGTDLVFERRESGSWVTKSTISA